jgi:hypothetical protein
VVLGEQSLLVAPAAEERGDNDRPKYHRDDAGGVGPLVAVEEGGLRRGNDLLGVLRILFSQRRGARERTS